MIGDNIKKYRKESFMSQDELAEKLNVTRQSISLWENNQTQPSLDNIIALSKLFNISTDELLSVSGGDGIARAVQRPVTANKNRKKSPAILLIAALILILAAVVLLITLKGRSKNISDVADEPSPTETADVDISSEAKDALSEADSDAHEQSEPKDIYMLLKTFVVNNGVLNGDYCDYSNSAYTYGGEAADGFSLTYWGDTDTVEFCVHSVVSDTHSINFYLRIPKANDGAYEYISSYYVRSSGEPVYQAKGTINASEFTNNYPLQCSEYFGDTDAQDQFMELSRMGICQNIECIKNFLVLENTGCSFEDLGFKNF